MSLLVAIILGIIFIPIYAYFSSSIFRWDDNRRAKRNDLAPMSNKQFNSLLVINGVCAVIFVIIAIYLSYFK